MNWNWTQVLQDVLSLLVVIGPPFLAHHVKIVKALNASKNAIDELTADTNSETNPDSEVDKNPQNA